MTKLAKLHLSFWGVKLMNLKILPFNVFTLRNLFSFSSKFINFINLSNVSINSLLIFKTETKC